MNDILESFKSRVLSEPPSLAILEEAEKIAAPLSDDEMPIWLAMLANGNPDLFADVIDEAKRWMNAEAEHDKPEELRPGDQRGQSITEFSLVLIFLAIGFLLFWGWFTTTPAYRSMGELAEQAANSLAADVDQSQSHGLSKHGAQAQAVYDCISKNGVYQVWTNPNNGRRANLCQVEDGKWGAQIVDTANREITAFTNRCKDFADFTRYLTNQGYIPPQ